MAGRPSALVPYPERVRITGDGEIIVRIAWPLAMAGLLVAACGGGAGSTAEESPSVAPSGFAADAENGYPYFPASATFAAESARLVGPHYSLQVDKVTFADRFTEQQANSFADGLNRFGPLRAPSGHRFMVVKTAEPSVDPGLRVDGSRGNQSSDDLRAEVRVGQTTLQLPVRLDALLGGETFVMTAPNR